MESPSARDAATSDASSDAHRDSESRASRPTAALGEGAIIALSLAVDAAGHAPAIDQWLDGELTAIARGHSAFGYYVPLRRTGPLGEQLVAPAFRSRVLAQWMDEIGSGRVLRSAPVPFAFVQRDGAASLWIAHGGLVGVTPSLNREPTDQCAVLARDASTVRSSDDVDAFVHAHKRQVGASVVAIRRERAGDWQIDRTNSGADFDGTDGTRARLTAHGECFDDRGEALAQDTAVGLVGASSGAMTPWGTALLLESNAARSYGESELALTSDGRLSAEPLCGFVEGSEVTPRTAADGASDFGCVSLPRARHRRDHYGYIAELDARVEASRVFDGQRGQRKLSELGRAHWRGVVVMPIAAQAAPLTIYAVDGRAGGTLFKFVTARAVHRSMDESSLRESLEQTRAFVAHVEAISPGETQSIEGRWVELSTTSEDRAPLDGRTVAATLRDAHAAGIGAFVTEASVRDALVTAAKKIGVAPLDGLRSIAWDSARGRLVLAAHGVRGDRAGSIVALSEAGDSRGFFWSELWHGHEGDDWFSAVHPTSITVDTSGTAWFATECEPELADCRDREGLFVLDLSESRRAGQPTVLVETWARALRVATAPERSVFSAPVFDDASETAFVGVRRAGALRSSAPHDE
ncbi:MAG: DUF839 domain-containing protein [Polyangiales bacterium]